MWRYITNSRVIEESRYQNNVKAYINEICQRSLNLSNCTFIIYA